MRYRPALDGLRAVAVALVIVFHSTFGSRWQLPGGFLGVDVFFVISGCLITALLVAEWQGRAALDLRGFYARRALRLGPALVVLLVAVVLVQHWAGPQGTQPLWQPIVTTLLYVANWWQVGHPAATTYLDHTWSLAIEEQFYLVWPITLLLMLRRGTSPRRVAALAGSSAIVVCAGRWTWLALWPPHGAYGYKVLYENTLTRGDSLLLGVVVGCLVTDPAVRRACGVAAAVLSGGRWRRLVFVELPPWLAAADLAQLIRHANNNSLWLYRWGFTLVALLAGVGVAHCMLCERSAFIQVLALPPLVGLGRISYGVYLFHVPIALVVLAHTGWGPLLRLLLISAMSITAAAVSYRLVERRALALGRRTRRTPLPAADVPAPATARPAGVAS